MLKLIRRLAGIAGISLGITCSVVARPDPVGTAFTYQGHLSLGGAAVDDTADFQFSLFDEAVGGNQIGATQTVNAIDVVDGGFTVDIDFGAGVFGIHSRWLDIAVRSPSGSGDFAPLTPRQRITPTPVTQFALAADGPNLTNLNASNITSGTIANAQTTGSSANTADSLVLRDSSGNFAANTITATGFSGSGAGLTNMSASNLNSGTVADARLSSNVALLNGTQTFTGENTFTNTLNVFRGNGSLLTNLNAANVTAGTLSSAQLPSGGNWALTTNLNVDSSTFVVDQSGNRVGIGTATPIQALDVLGSSVAAATSGSGPNGILRIRPSATSAILDIGGTGSPVAHAWLQSRDSANYATDYNLSLNPNGGNVGIGTTTPAVALDVIGGMRVSGADGAYVGDGTTARTWIGAAANANYIQSGNTAWNASRLLNFTGFNASPGTFAFNGNVGIGTINPGAPLHLQEFGAAGVTPSSSASLVLERNAGANYMQMIGGESTEQGIMFGKPTSGASGGIYYNSGSTPNGLNFRTNNNTVKMSILDSGHVGIGTTAPTNPLSVVASGTESGGVAGFNEVVAAFQNTNGGHTAVSINDTIGTQDSILYFNEGGVPVWGIRNDAGDGGPQYDLDFRAHAAGANQSIMGMHYRTDGGYAYMDFNCDLEPRIDNSYRLGFITHRWKEVWAANPFIQTSDARAKRNVQNISSGLEAIMQLRPVSYYWKEDADNAQRQLGLIAQEVAPIVPEAVVVPDDPELLYAMKYDMFIPLLIDAVQSHQHTIEQLREKNMELESRVAALDQAVQHLLAKENGTKQ